MLMPERGTELRQEPDPKSGRSEGLLRREAIAVRGVVQGVGFRPFVYRLATEEGLAGFIGNDTGGVTIEVEGPASRIESFRRRLQAEAPPLSRIDSVLQLQRCPRARPAFVLSPARPAAKFRPAFRPMQPPAPTACGSCSIRMIADIAIRF